MYISEIPLLENVSETKYGMTFETSTHPFGVCFLEEFFKEMTTPNYYDSFHFANEHVEDVIPNVLVESSASQSKKNVLRFFLN